MKVLLDTCPSVQAREALEAAGYDVIWGGDWDRDLKEEGELQRAG